MPNNVRWNIWMMCAVALLLAVFMPAQLSADVVTDWNHNMQQAVAAGGTSPLVSTRVTAIVSAAVYDAVNGIEGRYTPVHVDFAAAPGASRRAAAIQAAYATLVMLYPSQKATLDAERETSLSGITSDAAAVEDSQSIARGLAWGQTVADDIMAWRATDGFTSTPPPPAFLGGLAPGQWRPTPPANLPGAAPQFAYMTPWVIPYHADLVHPDLDIHPFRPAGPPGLATPGYAADFNETRTMGKPLSSLSTPGDSERANVARFWNGNTPLYWNRIAQDMSAKYNLTLSQNSRLFALLNVSMADAAIACWEAKYHYVFWRPITAIALADMDDNSATAFEAGWTPLLVNTPNHPEYPSGHSTVSGAAVGALQAVFGDTNAFTLTSEILPGITRSFPSFSAALLEVHDARVFGGIHFRSACRDGSVTGGTVAQYILQNAFGSLRGKRTGQINHNHGSGTVAGDGESSVSDVM